MTTGPDPLDTFLRRAAPPVRVSDDRLDRLISATLARAPERRPAPPSRRAAWADMLFRWALPLATAGILGVMVGQNMTPAESAPASLPLLSTSFVLAGTQ